MELGNFSEAAKTYQQVIDAAGSDIHGQMARLGLAEAQARSGQYDQAITTFRELAQRKDGQLPVDGILMQLGRRPTSTPASRATRSRRSTASSRSFRIRRSPRTRSGRWRA